MMRRALFFIVSLAAVVASVNIATADGAPPVSGIRVISSDATSTFVALAVNKAVVIDLPGDVKDVLVASPGIVNAVVRTSRRAFIIGMALGQTNVYFFDRDGGQVGALDITVTNGPPRAPIEPSKAVVVYRGIFRASLSCVAASCIEPADALPVLPPGYQNISSDHVVPNGR